MYFVRSRAARIRRNFVPSSDSGARLPNTHTHTLSQHSQTENFFATLEIDSVAYNQKLPQKSKSTCEENISRTDRAT